MTFTARSRNRRKAPRGLAVAAVSVMTLVPSVLGIGALSAQAGEVSQVVKVGAFPVDAVVSPDGSHILAANYGDDTVSVIDATSSTVTRTIRVDDQPRRIDFSPDGKTAYVIAASGASASMDILDLSEQAVVASVSIPGSPADISVASDGSTAWIADFFGQGLIRIDLATRTVKNTYPLGNLTSVAASADGSTVYVMDADGILSVFDTQREVVTAEHGFAPNGDFALTPDESALWTWTYSTDTQGVVRLDIATGATTQFSVPGTPDDITFNRDGSQAFVASQATGDVVTINTDNLSVLDRTPIGTYPIAVDVTPNDSSLIVADADAGTVSIVALSTAPSFTSAAPPATSVVGQNYSYEFVATGTPAPTFAVSSGTLPDGLALSAAGILAGIPTSVGASTFTVSATNGTSPAASTGPLTITVTPAVVATPEPLPTPSITSPTPGQTVFGSVTYAGAGTPGAFIALISYEGSTPPQSSGPIEDAFAATNPIQVTAYGTWTTTSDLAPGNYSSFAVEFQRASDGTVTNSSAASPAVSYTVATTTAATPTPANPGATAVPAATDKRNLAFTGTNTTTPIGLGALLLATGISLTLLARRRMSHIRHN